MSTVSIWTPRLLALWRAKLILRSYVMEENKSLYRALHLRVHHHLPLNYQMGQKLQKLEINLKDQLGGKLRAEN